jgi:hypothetical protein
VNLRRARIRALLAVVLTGLAAPGAAGKGVEIPAYDVTLTLTAQGHYRVEETIRYAYRGGSFTHGERTIPKAGIDALTLDGVTSPDTEITDVALRARREHWRIRWTYPERREPARYTLAYTVRGALRAENGRNVVDWDVVGSRWPVAIRDVRATIRIPRDFARTRVALSVPDGAEVARGDAHWRVRVARDRVPAGGRFRVRVGFPEAVAGAAPAANGTGGWLVPAVLAVLGLGAGLVPALAVPAFRAARARERAAAAETRAPPRLAPEEAAVLLGNDWRRGYPAAVFRLADAGALVLRQQRKPSRWATGRRIDAEPRVAPAHADTAFAAEVLRGCAGGPVKLRTLVAGLRWNRAPRDATRAALIDMGLLVERDRRHVRRERIGAMLLAVAAAGLIAMAIATGAWAGTMPVAGLALGGAIGLAVTSAERDRETGFGMLTRRHLRQWFRETRAGLLRQAESQPEAAVRAVLDTLSWLVVDPNVHEIWRWRFQSRLRGVHVSPGALPAWLVLAETAPADGAKLVDTLVHELLPAAAGGTAPGAPPGGGGGGGPGGGGGGAG